MTYPIRTAAAALFLIAAVALTGAECGTSKTLQPCPTEDSVGCVWVAPDRGNGKGRSYWVDRDGRVHYVSHDEARKLVRR